MGTFFFAGDKTALSIIFGTTFFFFFYLFKEDQFMLFLAKT